MTRLTFFKSLLIILIFILIPLNVWSQDWKQLGQHILGRVGGQLGWSLSISNDGNRIIVGDPWNDDQGGNNGYARVYELNNGNWILLGNEFQGSFPEDQLGKSVSISGDGSTIAIGAPKVHNSPGIDAGEVKVYRWDANSESWTQLGPDIESLYDYDFLGESVSISEDGNTIAIGVLLADEFPGTGPDGINVGAVRIYDWNGTNWDQRGANIFGETEGDLFGGTSVSLSGDGNTVAAGSRHNFDNGVDAGHIRIFRWSNLSWTLIGEFDGDPGGQLGYSVSLSSNGNEVIMGALGSEGSNISLVKVYEYSNLSWSQKGTNITGVGSSVDISENGEMIVIGGNPSKVFSWQNGWSQVGQDFSDLFQITGESVKISGDGNKVLASLYGIQPSNTYGVKSYTTSCDDLDMDGVCDNTTPIPDANFEQALIDLNIDSDGIINGEMLTSDAIGITSLNVSNKNISDLTGIEIFTDLQYLYCQTNQLTSLDVSNLSQLIRLEAQDNQLTSLNVTGLSNITHLFCWNNQLTTLDVSTLSSLERFYCHTNQLASLDVSNSPSLLYLQCHTNQLTSLNVIGLNNLIHLWCYSNLLPGLDVSNLSSLQFLECENNQLTSLNVANSTSLKLLNCHSNQLTSLDVSTLTSLENFFCHTNQLTSLDVSNSPNLLYLQCHTNQLTSLNVIGLNNLIHLWCYSNLLPGLDVSNLYSLQFLECENNQLTSLNVSGNSNLKLLTCHTNQLTSLDISTLVNLENLYCNTNQLISLDISNSGSLLRVHCQSNQLSSLDARNGNNSNIISFISFSNPNLYCIYVDDPAYSNTNWTNIDPQSTFTDDPTDTDMDGICDDGDNCPNDANPMQEDMDTDGIGDACDNCPSISNPMQEDNNGNGIGDVCEATTAIPDPNFEQALIDLMIDSDGMINGQMFTVDAVGVTSLDVNEKNIADLTGIEAFVDLEILRCFTNQLTSLDVSMLTNLQELYCPFNQITSLNVTGLSNLRELWCYVNQLTNLDISTLNNLETVWCSLNPLGNIDVSNNLTLEYLICASNQLTSLDVTGLSNLIYLFCYDNQLTSLDISTNPNLTEFLCYDNQLISLEARNGNNANIIAFDASSNPDLFCIYVDDITYANANWTKDPQATFTDDPTDTDMDGICDDGDICPTGGACEITLIPDPNFEQALIDLMIDSDGIVNGQMWTADAVGVTTLDVGNKNISDLTGIEAFIDLQILRCFTNQLTSLDVANNTSLTELNCFNNQLQSLNINGLNNLRLLGCGDNMLTNLDISTNLALEELFCGENQLTSLNVTNNNSINTLHCYDNQLTSLDVSNLMNLGWLACAENLFTSLDLTNSVNLFRLTCQYSPMLQTLDIRNGNNSNITLISVFGNPQLYCIYVDDPVYSTTNWVSIDPHATFTDTPTDTDMDGICDAGDNCPNDANPLQEDFDMDGIGDACDDCIAGMDMVSPTISCTLSIDTYTSDPSCITPLPDYTTTASATDNCDPSPILTQSPAPGTLITGCDVDLYVKIYATDASGNKDSCIIHVFTSDILTCPMDTVIYVDHTSTGLNTGLSWADAIREPQKASRIASMCAGVKEVWVSEGTYFPSRIDDRTETISLPSNIRWYGGFSGTETMKNQRDPIAHPTIFSGDIGAIMDNTDNSYHVLTARNASQITLIDGFTIQHGYADGMGDDAYGGGLHNDGNASGNSQIQVKDCIFSNNYALEGGAAVYENATSMGEVYGHYTHSTFEYNTTLNLGGAMLINGFAGIANPIIEDCEFKMNQALLGGAVYILGFGGQADPIIDRSTFGQNIATDKGGALFINARNMGQSSVLIRNSVLYRNEANFGGAIYNDGLNGTVGTHSINSTFALNVATTGPSIYNFYSTPTTENSVLWSNHPSLEIADVASTNTLNSNHIRGVNMAEYPWFVDSLNNNYNIEPCSPLVNAGVDLMESTEDITGMQRPFPGGVSDIGAYEYGGNPYGNNGSVMYVDGNASGNNDGTSWNDAYDDLYALLGDPPCGGRIDTVWVTSGTYMPPNDPDAPFEVWDGMVIIGNFSGGEARVASRTRSSTPTTIISGDIGIMGDNSDNSRHVIKIPPGLTALFQDVIIEQGNANGSGDDAEGAAIFNNGVLMLKNVLIRMNQGLSQIYNRDPGASLTLDNCMIIKNGSGSDVKNLMGGTVVIRGITEVKN
jgi:Leucine-rich repeat (LRR) protein